MFVHLIYVVCIVAMQRIYVCVYIYIYIYIYICIYIECVHVHVHLEACSHVRPRACGIYVCIMHAFVCIIKTETSRMRMRGSVCTS